MSGGAILRWFPPGVKEGRKHEYREQQQQREDGRPRSVAQNRVNASISGHLWAKGVFTIHFPESNVADGSLMAGAAYWFIFPRQR